MASHEAESSLDQLNLSGRGLGVVGLREVFADLRDDNVIVAIDLSDNLTAADTDDARYPAMLQSMLTALSANDTLVSLCYANNHLGPSELEQLVVPLSRRQWVRLDLSSSCLLGPSNRIYSPVMQLLRRVARENVQELRLEGCHLHSETLAMMNTLFTAQSKLRRLELPRNKLGLDCHGRGNLSAMMEFSRAMLFSTALEDLDLSFNYLQDDHVAALADALPRVIQLRSLQLRGNDIHARAANTIAQAITRHEHLIEFDLAENPIGPAGAPGLRQLLEQNTVLKTLRISSCLLGEEAGELLVEAMTVNYPLTTLEVANNGFSSEVEDRLRGEVVMNAQIIECNNTGHFPFQLPNTTELQRTILENKVAQLPQPVLKQLRSDHNLQVYPSLRAAILRVCPYTRRELLEPTMQKIQSRLELSYELMQQVRAQMVIRRWLQKVLRKRQQSERARKYYEYYKSL